MSENQPTVPVSSAAAKDSAVPGSLWLRLTGLVVMLLSAVLAVIAIFHGASRIAVLGWGGFQLPSPQAWLGSAADPVKISLFAVEVWGGVLAVWVTYLSLFVALTVWGLPRLGDPKERTSLQNLIGEAMGVLFALLTTVIGFVTTISVSGDEIKSLGVSMSVLVIPVFIGGIGMLYTTLRSFIGAYRVLKAENPTPSPAPATKKPSPHLLRLAGERPGSLNPQSEAKCLATQRKSFECRRRVETSRANRALRKAAQNDSNRNRRFSCPDSGAAPGYSSTDYVCPGGAGIARKSGAHDR